jgi:hypothetical protein
VRKVTLTTEQKNFFWVEIGNEHLEETGQSRDGCSVPGGVNPATLASALDSLAQAPDDVVADWCEPDADLGKVNVLQYECDTLDDIGILYGEFDRLKSRDRSDVGRSLLATWSVCHGLSAKSVQELFRGFTAWAIDGSDRHAATPEAMATVMRTAHAALTEKVRDFLAKIRGLGQALVGHVFRRHVIAAMFETFNKVQGPSEEFWTAVAEGGTAGDDPRNVLRTALLKVKVAKIGGGGARGKVVAIASGEEIYRWCIHAWNRWRKGEK